MYKRKNLLLLCLLITLVLPTLPAQATGDNPPLFILQSWRRDGIDDLWSWSAVSESGQPEAFAGCVGDRVESPLILSPTQPLVAYLSTAEIWLEIMGQGWSGADFPNDLLICNLETGEITEVAGQPEDASVGENSEWIYHSHSIPSWSPDGTKLAWTKYIGDNILQLMIYDLASGVAETFIENLNPDGLVGLPARKDVYWSEVGIGVDNFKGYELYDETTGALLNTVTFPEYSQLQFWITHAGKSYLGYNDTDNIWYLIDLLTGKSQVMPGLPELYSVANPAGLAVRYEEEIPPPYNEITPPHRTPRWSVVDGENIIPVDYERRIFNGLIAISPDGNSIAYWYEDRLWMWEAGEAAIANGMEDFVLDHSYVSIVWTPMAWRVGTPAE